MVMARDAIFFFRWGWGQGRWFHLMRVAKEVRLTGGRMKRKVGSEIRVRWGMSLERPGRAMYHLTGYRFLLSAPWGSTGEFGTWKWLGICFQRFIVYVALTHMVSETQNRVSNRSFWFVISTPPTQVHSCSPDLGMLALLFRLLFCYFNWMYWGDTG